MTAPQKFPDIPWALIQALHSAFPPNRSGDSPNSLLQRIGERRVLDRLVSEFEKQQNCTVEMNLVLCPKGVGTPDTDAGSTAPTAPGAASDADFGQAEHP